MRKALAVGINYYEKINSLYGCVNDAETVAGLFQRHEDGRQNFDCNILKATNSTCQIDQDRLKDEIEGLFSSTTEIALFYFSGHGHVESTGGYLLTSEASRGDHGVGLNTIMKLASDSKAANKIIILDSCYSGEAGTSSLNPIISNISEGMTILTASRKDEYALEKNEQGIFTHLLIDALEGGAANLTGDITPGSIYSHIDQSLGSWDQRPVFKTNVERFVSLREVKPPIELTDLQKITELFPTSDYIFDLDPSFEPEMAGRSEGTPQPDPVNTKKFGILQQYNRLNLLVPVGTKHMWHAAMENKSCKLTRLGKHYHRLVQNERI